MAGKNSSQPQRRIELQLPFSLSSTTTSVIATRFKGY
jgi:hypothetical protein